MFQLSFLGCLRGMCCLLSAPRPQLHGTQAIDIREAEEEHCRGPFGSSSSQGGWRPDKFLPLSGWRPQLSQSTLLLYLFGYRVKWTSTMDSTTNLRVTNNCFPPKKTRLSPPPVTSPVVIPLFLPPHRAGRYGSGFLGASSSR